MKPGMRMLAVLFGPGRQAPRDVLAAPGDADCRWRAAATLGRTAAVNDDAVGPQARRGPADEAQPERR